MKLWVEVSGVGVNFFVSVSHPAIFPARGM